MYGVAISLLFVLYTSCSLPLTDIPVNVTDTVRKLYGECFEIFVHMAMFLHGKCNDTEIPSEMLGPASFCFNKYAHLCQRGTVEGYVSTQQDSSCSFQGDIIYEPVMNWSNFTNGTLTYQEAYCMICIITIMMNHSQVTLCSVLSICSATLSSTQCEGIYTDLLMQLQENCHSSSEYSECKIVYTYNNFSIISTMAAVFCSIAALFAGGAYVHVQCLKKTYQSCKCGQHPQPHFSLPHSAPPENIPVGQQVCTLSVSDLNRRIVDIHHGVQHHNFKQEFISPSSFLNHHQEHKCAGVPADSTYETCNFRESISEQQNEDIVDYMEPLYIDIPEYLEILPDLPDYNNFRILAEHANQQQVGFGDLQQQYAMVGEMVQSGQPDRNEEPFEKEMRVVNENFHKPQQQINLKNVVEKDTNLEKSDRLDKLSLSEGLPEREHIHNKASALSLTDDLVEIVIQNANQLFSENTASPASEVISLKKQ